MSRAKYNSILSVVLTLVTCITIEIIQFLRVEFEVEIGGRWNEKTGASIKGRRAQILSK